MFHGYWWGGGFWFGWIFWIVIIALIVWVVINQGKYRIINHNNPYLESPLDILKKRYARGEINKEQFDQMKKDLQ